MQRAPKAKQVGGKSQLPKIKKLFGTTYNTKHQFLEMERIQNQPYSFMNPESRPNFLLSHMASAWCFGDIVCHDLRRRNEIRKRFHNIKRTIAGFVVAAVVVVVVAGFDS